MVYVTYEAVRQGIPKTEVCDAKVWHKLDDTHEVMSNTCKFVVESVEEEAGRPADPSLLFTRAHRSPAPT